jgi:predicted O-methyltransferase YrrM
MSEFTLDPAKIRGFLDADEGLALMEAVREVAHKGPCLEIGSYCGKSTIYLGHACKQEGISLFALDHHRGSEEHQPGEEYHDPEIYNAELGSMDSFPEFRQNIRKAKLEETVVPIVSYSTVVAQYWANPLSLVFIDGGHSEENSLSDYLEWQRHIVDGGVLAIHDVHADPQAGGQGPYRAMQEALQSQKFILWKQIKTLALLRRSRR